MIKNSIPDLEKEEEVLENEIKEKTFKSLPLHNRRLSKV